MNLVFCALLCLMATSVNSMAFMKLFTDDDSVGTGLQESVEKPDIKSLLPHFKLMTKPSREERDPEKLMKQLGANFNSEFSSIQEPASIRVAREPTTTTGENENRSDGSGPPAMRTEPEMSEELSQLKFVVKKNGKKKEYGPKMSHKLQQWLWTLSRCPVKYRWMDFGENVFPRYVKRGTCAKKKTCSFPAGMKCKPAKWREIYVLLYACTHARIQNSVKNCQWRPMRLHILTECSCGCQTPK